MSARSAQRTRWRRWRMGRGIAGGKDRDGRLSGLAGTSCRRWRRDEASPSSASFFEQNITRTNLLMKQISSFAYIHNIPQESSKFQKYVSL